VAEYSTGFVYLVSRTGVTGERAALSDSLAPLIEKMRGVTALPLAAGFGISTPDQAGVSVPVIRHFAGKIPLLGVCLGHQSIGQAFGAKIVHAKQLMHGKVSSIAHRNTGVFRELPNPLTATRYHSLVIERGSLPDCLDVTAWTEDGEIMGVRHKQYHVEGVQFHPESILTERGHDLLENFLRETRA